MVHVGVVIAGDIVVLEHRLAAIPPMPAHLEVALDGDERGEDAA